MKYNVLNTFTSVLNLPFDQHSTKWNTFAYSRKLDRGAAGKVYFACQNTDGYVDTVLSGRQVDLPLIGGLLHWVRPFIHISILYGLNIIYRRILSDFSNPVEDWKKQSGWFIRWPREVFVRRQLPSV